MAWGEEVHESRLAQSLSEARVSRSLKRRNRSVPVTHNSGPIPAIAAVIAAASWLLFQRNRKTIEAMEWRQLPIVKQFNMLVFGSGGTKLGKVSTKKKPATLIKPGEKPSMSTKTLSPPAQTRTKGSASAATPSSVTPAQAAGAAAVARSGPPIEAERVPAQTQQKTSKSKVCYPLIPSLVCSNDASYCPSLPFPVIPQLRPGQADYYNT